MQYSTVQYSTVQYSTVQYSTVQYSTVQYSIVQYSTVQYNTEQYSTVQYSAVQYCKIQYSALCRITHTTMTSQQANVVKYQISQIQSNADLKNKKNKSAILSFLVPQMERQLRTSIAMHRVRAVLFLCRAPFYRPPFHTLR